jgi:ribonuclease P protein component
LIRQKFNFAATLRLKTPTEFQKVFANPSKSTDQYFTLLAIKNQRKHPRLGLAIAKKNIKRAVDRNKIKRITRESFRLQQHQLIPIDIVVLARKEATNASSDHLARSLTKHWYELVKQCNGC